MVVKATVTLNIPNINKLIQAAQEAQKQTTYTVKDDIIDTQVTPKLTGNLESTASVDESNVENGETSISFDTPYARRMYFHPEYNFHQDKNANAQGLWMQSYIDGDKQEMVADEFAKAFKNNAGGIIK